MAYSNTSVSYSEIDSQISKIQAISENGHYVLQSINVLKSHYSVSNSDMSNELIKILDNYIDAHNAVIELCSKSISMLSKAKYVYSNSDTTTDAYVSSEED